MGRQVGGCELVIDGVGEVPRGGSTVWVSELNYGSEYVGGWTRREMVGRREWAWGALQASLCVGVICDRWIGGLAWRSAVACPASRTTVGG